MITGAVKSDEARIRLKTKGPRQQVLDVEAIIDTSFTGSLTLPSTAISVLGLRWRSFDSAILADGSTRTFNVYKAKIVWEGKVRQILVSEADTDPLIGMKLMRGFRLTIDVRAGGKATIKRLPSRR